jgi:hypothetical protein
MSTPALRLHRAPTTPSRPPVALSAVAQPAADAAVSLAAHLDALLARLPSEAFTAMDDDHVQPVAEAMRTAVSDLRHARAALAWIARPPSLDLLDAGADAGRVSGEALAAKAAALGCSVEEFHAELASPHTGLPLFIP